jgi:hypothetical protein
MDSPLAMLGFLSIFHFIGAVALARGLRGLWHWVHNRGRGVGNSFFFVLWGAGFGCMPFVFGLTMASDQESGALYVLPAELLVWAGAFLITLLAWGEVVDWLRPFLHADVFLVAFGGVFMTVGAAVGSFVIRDDLLFGVLFGGIFIVVGGLLFAAGVWKLLNAMHQQ